MNENELGKFNHNVEIGMIVSTLHLLLMLSQSSEYSMVTTDVWQLTPHT